MSEPILALEGVVKDYGAEIVTRALHGVDLTVARGEFTALVGPSGSGKSTLLNLMGLLDRPTAGTVRVLGADIAELDERGLTALRGRSIGFVFQFHHLIPSLNAIENVMMPLAIAAGRLRADQRDRAAAVLEAVGLAGRADAKPSQLSGGQQQRVAIARALVARPPLVLADEPTGNLDTRSADDIFALMRRFNRDDGVAFVVVTHDPRMAERCDRVVELIDGRVSSDRRP
ncbi:ABC transporter ATP-binding protein [Haliangium sp.]|uniref:ABC transporter ATP-binding protein n=1 Tax=Haliangium sp. TaxID=2663208 RepID=UPI003D119EDC